jgi:hypothetical protein
VGLVVESIISGLQLVDAASRQHQAAIGGGGARGGRADPA